VFDTESKSKTRTQGDRDGQSQAADQGRQARQQQGPRGPTLLSYETVQADRIVPGGSYRHENITPACGRCNIHRANKRGWVAPKSLAVAS
jgi:hypothetical protein